MPTFVIHSLDRPPQKSSLAGNEVRVGRDDGVNHLVLPGSTVSREHAVFALGRDGRWSVHCVSETNPIVVDGTLTTASALVTEGSEVMIGTDHLLVFTENEVTAKAYLGGQGYFVKSECIRCHWNGMVSTLRRQPVCPKCGGTDLKAENVYDRDQASALAQQGTTAAVDPRVVRAHLQKMKAAKQSRIERVDGRPGPARKDLSEREAVTIGKADDATFRLSGLVMGDGVRIAWDGNHWTATASLTWPSSMRVNGATCKTAVLKDGDIIEVGSNRFRFVTE